MSKTDKITKATEDLIVKLASQGGSLNEIVSQLGRPLSPEEKQIADDQRAQLKLRRANKATSKPKSGSSWRQELERVKYLSAKLDLEEQQGKLVRTSEVLQTAQADASLIKMTMLGAPNVLAPQLLGIKTVNEIQAILNDWFRSALEGWAESLAGEQGKAIDNDDSKPLKAKRIKKAKEVPGEQN